MKWLFALTLFISSALLFLVQPMFGKMLLPFVGSTPAAWTTCMMFFQVALLLGYGYAHVMRIPPAVHVALLLLPMAVLPIGIAAGSAPLAGGNPTLWILASLALSVGAPFLALSTSAPLLQRWFPGEPYWLYAASNAGSLFALAAYPTIVEPNLPLATQGRWFGLGYALFAAMTIGCVVAIRRHVSLWKRPPLEQIAGDGNDGHNRAPRRASLRTMAHWILLAFVPSSLMIGATTYISTDIAAIPLFWMVPLAIYLISFIMVFARPPTQAPVVKVAAFKVLLIPLFVLAISTVATRPGLLVAHLVLLALASFIFHGELVRLRPARSQLTSFYLALALGGALGGLWNAAGPLLFMHITEYPITMAIGCLLLPVRSRLADVAGDRERQLLASVGIDAQTVTGLAPTTQARKQRRRRWDIWVPLFICTLTLALGSMLRDASNSARVLVVFAAPAVLCALLSIRQPFRLGCGLLGILVAAAFGAGQARDVLWQGRSFFGTLRVEDTDVKGRSDAEPAKPRVRELIHGTIVHGQQSLDPALRREPIGYYYRGGPVGQLFAMLRTNRQGKPAEVAVLGLGSGVLAAYGQAGDRFTFFEIDAMVERVARDPRLFTWLADSAAQIAVVLGDGRLAIGRETNSYDVIFADAFSSDSIPMHLITREALARYLSRLAPGGVIIFHISNRFLRLEGVLGALAADAGLVARTCHSPTQDPPLKMASRWVVMARSTNELAALGSGDLTWNELSPGGMLWTDDFSNLFDAILW